MPPRASRSTSTRSRRRWRFLGSCMGRRPTMCRALGRIRTSMSALTATTGGSGPRRAACRRTRRGRRRSRIRRPVWTRRAIPVPPRASRSTSTRSRRRWRFLGSCMGRRPTMCRALGRIRTSMSALTATTRAVLVQRRAACRRTRRGRRRSRIRRPVWTRRAIPVPPRASRSTSTRSRRLVGDFWEVAWDVDQLCVGLLDKSGRRCQL